MKTQGSFNYKVNGENKTKEEIDIMDLSNMSCTVDGLIVSYSFLPRKSDSIREKVLNSALDNQKSHILGTYSLTQSEGLRVISAKTHEELAKFVKEMQLGGAIVEQTSPTTFSVSSGWVGNNSTYSPTGAPKEKIRTKTEEILGEIDKYQQQENGGVLKGGEFPYDFIEDFITSQKEASKDDVITSSSRGEKEMMSDLVGIKETEGKLDYSEINFRLLDLMAKRFMDNKVKYPKGNSKKALDKDSILWAAFRHIRKMIQPVKNDPETYEEHLSAVATNMSIILDQIDLEKSK